jgi:hypothetical protein
MSATRTMPVLKPEDHEFFLAHGYVVLKNAVPPQPIASAVELLECGTFRGVPGAADYESVQGAALDVVRLK